jgi:2-methylisocitrate lyase-like PEP mutase family enzyme
MNSQSQKAEALRALHQGPKIVLFANVWDVAGARTVEALGFPAIATTSAGIANLLGYVDGQNISRGEMLDMVSRIARAVKVPVTADMEAGYARTAEEMYDTATELIEAGAVGLNLEDSEEEEQRLTDLSLYLEKIGALREAGEKCGINLVLNARTDAYWWQGARPETRMAEAVHRANAFRHAGADCVFVPGLKAPAEIAEFLRQSPGPLNVLGIPGAPTVTELECLGVRRVSIGSGGFRAALGLMKRIARQLREEGKYDLIAEFLIPAAETNRLLRKE